MPPNSAIRWHGWSISKKRFLYRQFRWSATDEVMTQTWFFIGVLIHCGQGKIACQCRTKTGYFCSGSFLEVPLRIECLNLISNVVFPLPDTTEINIGTTPELILFFLVGGRGSRSTPVFYIMYRIYMPDASK